MTLSLIDKIRAKKAAAQPPMELMADTQASQADHLERFIEDTLPPEGQYALWTKTDKQHHWYGERSAVTAAVQEHIERGTQGLYFATARFTEQAAINGNKDARTQANVLAKQCFYGDFDAGATKLAKHGPEKVYATQRDGLVDLTKFCKKTGLVPTYINSSGEGLHGFWCTKEPITAQQWTPVAKRLSRLFKQEGLKEDSAVTADSARILRPVGVLHENGKTVSVLKYTGKKYDFAEFSQLVSNLLDDADEDEKDPFAGADGRFGDAAKVNGSLGDLGSYSDRTYDIGRITPECATMRHVLDCKGDVEEPLWHAMLGVIKFTTEPEKLAQIYSSGHAKYDKRETQRKLDNWKTGPTSCAEFARYSSKCSTCPHKDKIKSPITFGQILTPATGVDAKPAGTLLKVTLKDWVCDREGNKIRPMQTTGNAASLAQLHGWTLRYNVMTKRTETTMPGQRIARDDHENAALAFLGDACVRAGMSRNGLAELVDAVAGSNAYHPAHDWIMGIPWDGVPRSALFHESLELLTPSQAPLVAKLMDAFMLQGIGALERNGISAQGILVLAGNQDVQKTRWVKSLCPVLGAVREGIHFDPLNKDSVLLATNGWISELGELDSTTRKADVSALKAFITRDEDILRPAYARRENAYARRTVFVGSVNGTGFLVDETGDRRFWTVAVRRCHLLPPETMQQVWAEYRVRYLAGERWYFDAATKAELAESNSAHRAVDPIRERILTTFDWSAIDWANADPESLKRHASVTWLTATDVCLRIGLDRPSKADATRAGSIVSELNRVSFRKSNGAKLLAVPPFARRGV